MLGGSIQPQNVRMKDIEPRAPRTDEEDPRQSWAKVLQRLASAEAPAVHGMQLSQFRDDLTSYRWINEVGYNQHNHFYQRHPEERLYKGALPLFSGHGAAKDAPATHKFFMESFQQHPELLQMYTRGGPKPRQKISTQAKAHLAQPHLQVPHSRIK